MKKQSDAEKLEKVLKSVHENGDYGSDIYGKKMLILSSGDLAALKRILSREQVREKGGG